MALLTRATLITTARLKAQDDNTAANALTDAQYTTLANGLIQSYAAAFPEHFIINAESWAPTFSSGVADWTSGTTADYNVRRVLEVLHSADKDQLEKYEPYRIREMLARDATAGTPTRYALVHKNESTTMTTKPNTFTVLVWPPPSGAQTMFVSYEFYPKDLSADSDLVRGFGDADSYWIADLLAAKAAWLNGKNSEFISGLLSTVPQEIQSRLHVKEGLLLPRNRPGEVVI